MTINELLMLCIVRGLDNGFERANLRVGTRKMEQLITEGEKRTIAIGIAEELYRDQQLVVAKRGKRVVDEIRQGPGGFDEAIEYIQRLGAVELAKLGLQVHLFIKDCSGIAGEEEKMVDCRVTVDGEVLKSWSGRARVDTAIRQLLGIKEE